MIDDACSRREFLKKLAMLSGGALMLSATAIGCSSADDAELPSVIGRYFFDADMQKVELRGNDHVPVHTQFVFVFSTDMRTAPIWTDITFMDSNSNPIVFTSTWDDARTLTLTPSADLSFNTDYILTVKDALSSKGNRLNDYASASAAFRTANA
jgi:Big-like domain-containing protein